MKAYFIAAAVCIAMPAFAQAPDKGTPDSGSAATATTSAGEPTGPATSKGSADHKGDGDGVTGQSTGPGTHPNAKKIAKAKKTHPEGSSHTSPE